MNGAVELPHELFIRMQFALGKTVDEVEDILDDHGLAVPTTKFLSNLGDEYRVVPTENLSKFEEGEDEPPSPKIISKIEHEAIELLDHDERELIDALCIIYVKTPKNIQKTLKNFGVELALKTVKKYQELFWHPSAVCSRRKWRQYLAGLDDKDTKRLLMMAKKDDRELLFWILGKNTGNINKKEMLERAVELASMKLLETRYMSNDFNGSKIAINWGNQLVIYMRELAELETQDQYNQFMEILQDGVALQTDTKEHPAFSEIIPEEEMEDTKAKVIPFLEAKNKKDA